MGLGGGEGTLEGVFGWGEGEMGGEDAAVVGGGPSLAIGLTDAGNTADEGEEDEGEAEEDERREVSICRA
jgi:hypothetical protein